MGASENGGTHPKLKIKRKMNSISQPEKRGRKPGTSWNGETRVERMGGILGGVGGGGGSARLY